MGVGKRALGMPACPSRALSCRRKGNSSETPSLPFREGQGDGVARELSYILPSWAEVLTELYVGGHFSKCVAEVTDGAFFSLPGFSHLGCQDAGG